LSLLFWAVVLLGGMAVTYATRLSFLVFIGHETLPPALRRGLRFVAPSILAALILPALTLDSATHLALWPLTPRLLAGAIAMAFTWRFRNTWLTIAAGMASLWILQSLLAA
jgi:branched chain amino acid efflux pump